MGDDFGVESGAPYTIVDVFDRHIKIGKLVSVTEYLHLYGAELKAWEALEDQPGRVVESGRTKDRQGQLVADRYNDYLYLTNTGVDDQGNRLGPIGPLGTAQRSQTLLRSDRMTEGIFKDTLNFSTRAQVNQRQALWIAASSRQGATPAETRRNLERAVNEARARDDALNQRADPRDQRLSAADKKAAIERRLREVEEADDRRIISSPVLSVPQDVILQLRVDATRHDLMVFEGNRLSVFAPYFFKDNKYIGDKSNRIFKYLIQFTPGTATSQLVQPPHRRP